MPLPSVELHHTVRSDLAACRSVLRAGSKSFHAASLMLPSRVRKPASALYAFCRVADDTVDLGHGTRSSVGMLRERLDRAYSGRPHANAVDRAMAHVISDYAIPRDLPEALLEGLEWDASGRRYEDIDTLYDYAARVAGTVGAMMALLMGARSSEALNCACDLGVAMQLTNIARDVGEDARAGRIYLPIRWLEDEGLDPKAWLAAPEHSEALSRVVTRLLSTADEFYERGRVGIDHLPRDCRPGIHAARLVYREIGKTVARNGFDSVSQRAVVSGGRKIALIGHSVAATFVSAAKVSAPPLRANQFLVEAVPPMTRMAGRARTGTAMSPTLDDRVAWVVNLFEALERRERLARAAGRS